MNDFGEWLKQRNMTEGNRPSTSTNAAINTDPQFGNQRLAQVGVQPQQTQSYSQQQIITGPQDAKQAVGMILQILPKLMQNKNLPVSKAKNMFNSIVRAAEILDKTTGKNTFSQMAQQFVDPPLSVYEPLFQKMLQTARAMS